MGHWEVMLKGYWASSGGDETAQKWTVAMVAQLWEHTTNDGIVHLKGMNCIVQGLCRNKAVIRKSTGENIPGLGLAKSS